MTKEEQLAKAILIATVAHDGQFDKGGKPYILHPLHLMNQLMFDLELATIAVLHDVVEDTLYNMNDMMIIGFSHRVTLALEMLTHERGVPYDRYIKNIASNYDALRVKRKDLEHNSDITRLKGVEPQDIKRMKKYHKAFLFLGDARKHHIK